jgi:hypothetical protein
VGIECKARVTLGTHQRERAHTELLSRFQGMSLSPSNTGTAVGGAPELYTIISALSTDFCAYIDSSHEAVQLLHQAYVCGFKYVLLLVGDRTGNIIRGKYQNKKRCIALIFIDFFFFNLPTLTSSKPFSLK